MSEAVVPQDYKDRIEAVGEWKLRVTSFRLGEKFICKIDNVDPGATLVRTEGETRELAESAALARARERVSRTRTFE